MPVGCAGSSIVLLQCNRPTTLLSLRIREFDIRILAHMLNSLVRVSRREKENHFVHQQLEHVTCKCLNVYNDTNKQVCCVVRASWTAFTNQRLEYDAKPAHASICWQYIIKCTTLIPFASSLAISGTL